MRPGRGEVLVQLVSSVGSDTLSGDSGHLLDSKLVTIKSCGKVSNRYKTSDQENLSA